MNREELINEAFKAMRNAYAPYSGYHVGACVLCKDGKTFYGANIENASYTPTNCAERTAFFKAVSEGVKEFDAIAIVGGPDGADPEGYCPPCGVCRQVMAEFCTDSFLVICAKSEDEYRVNTLTEVLPDRFGPKDLLD